jgi:hypothetical protein
MKRIIANSVVVLVGIAIGVCAGWLLGALTFLQRPNTTHYLAFAGIGWGVSEGAFDDNATDAKDLLRKNLVLLEAGLDPRSTVDPSIKRALLLQAAFTKARLSILEKKFGNEDQAKSYMSAAQADLKSLGWRDYSAAHIEQAVRPHHTTSTSAPSVKPASAQLPGAQTK